MKKERFRLIYKGAVQGVGFRPTVYKIAKNLGLKGYVKNSPLGAIVEIEGEKEKIEEFILKLPSYLPSIAKITSFEKEKIKPKNDKDFKIVTSRRGRRKSALTSPDAKICNDCLKEMQEESNRRFHYPFTNCTNCGPRFTIVKSFPYDRVRTSMACFKMCENCKREYTNPLDRRYHAEAICCKECGPKLKLIDNKGREIAEDEKAIEKTKQILSNGKIVAIKGLGGFHLAVDIQSEKSIIKLRKRKRRISKPFAVMVKDIKTAEKFVFLTKNDVKLLVSPKSPIIVARRKIKLSNAIAPSLNDLGVFIPTTPLHIELFRESNYEALIMTSGNYSDEPIAISNREALNNLHKIADYFLIHNRDIIRRADDSVFKSSDKNPFAVRLSRGYVPERIKIGWESPKTILSLGAFLQNASSITIKDEVFLTPHIGDLDNLKARDFMVETIFSFKNFLEIDFECIAVDLHRDYFSTMLGEKLSKEYKIPIVRIQHHLSHLASVLEEYGNFPQKDEKCYGIILDGTGLGTDGTLWGGEFLSISGDLKFKRLSHLKPFQLLGNEMAIKEPIRVAFSLCKAECEEDLFFSVVKRSGEIKKYKFVSSNYFPYSSGAGRLFEAAGAILKVAPYNRYEGECAIAFESLAKNYKGKCENWNDIEIEKDNLFPTSKFFVSFLRRVKNSSNKEKVAMEFHKNFVRISVEIAKRIFQKESFVGLSGGCFNNTILRKEFYNRLKENKFFPLLHYNIPSGDGGISFGQAVLSSRSLFLNKEIEEV